MAQAGESDGKVIQRLRDHETAFAALTPDAAANQLPRLQVRTLPNLYDSHIAEYVSRSAHTRRSSQPAATTAGADTANLSMLAT
jgi:hypothetical protein